MGTCPPTVNCSSVIPGNRKIFHKGQTFLTMLLEVLHILPMQCKKKAFQYLKVKNHLTFKYLNTSKLCM